MSAITFSQEFLANPPLLSGSADRIACAAIERIASNRSQADDIAPMTGAQWSGCYRWKPGESRYLNRDEDIRIIFERTASGVHIHKVDHRDRVYANSRSL